MFATGVNPRPSLVSDALAKDRLGTAAVAQFVLTSAAPLLVVAGIVTTGWAVTGVVSTPVAFVVLAVLLGVFAFGYAQMSRRVVNSGALYTFSARGLGRPAGVAAGLLALVSYNVMQVGAYGMFGAVAAYLLEQHFGLHVAWWVCALVPWTAAAVMGWRRVDFNGKVLAVLLSGEVVFVIIASIVGLAHPADGQISVAALDPAGLFSAGGAVAGAAFAIAWTGYVGFEQAPVYAEESRQPERTVPAAIFGSLGLMVAVYTISSWAMSVAVGPEHIVDQSRAQSVELLFTVAAPLGSAVGVIGHLLLLTSLFAGLLAFHNTANRYFYALGREGVLPRIMGRTSPRTGAPIGGSIAQSVIGLTAIIVYAVAGWDPITQMMFYLASAGGVGVLLVLTLAAVAILVYLWRHSGGGGWWSTVIAPLVAAVGLVGVCVLCLTNYATLLGVAAGHPLTWIFPTAYGVILALGLAWGLIMRLSGHRAYPQIGNGATVAPATVATATGAAR